MNVSLGDELVEQGVSLLIAHFILNRHESVLEVHDSILQLHGAFWHVCLLPGSLNELLLPLNLRLRDVLCLWLHIFDDVGLGLLQFSQVLILLLRDHSLQLLQVVALWSKLISIQVAIGASFLIVCTLCTIRLSKSSPCLLSVVKTLLHLLVQVKN